MPTRRKRRPVVFKRDIRFGKQTRIRVPQPMDRPLKLRQSELLREEWIREDPWWWQLHRRGFDRARVGLDPLEARAVPKKRVRGTLPERIMYRALITVMRFQPDADFTFQSSMQGGRMELGGIVADFVFPYLRIIIQVQGPTHNEFLRKRKDEEQQGILESMGFKVYNIEDATVYDEYQLENWLRRTFGYGGRGLAGGAAERYGEDEEIELSAEELEMVLGALDHASEAIDNLL